MKYSIPAILILSLLMIFSCKEKSRGELDAKAMHQNLKQSFIAEGYPEYYAGSYMKDHTLYFLTSNHTDKTRKDVERRTKGKDFFIKTLKGGILRAVSEELDSIGLDFYKYPNLQYYSHYIDHKNQKIVVMLGDTTEQNIDFFTSHVLESPFIHFAYSSPIVPE